MINTEVFELIEVRGSISASELAEALMISKRSAQTKLSKWANYFNPAKGEYRHYLEYIPPDGCRTGARGREGRYKLGPDWWGELAFSSAKYE